MYIDMFYQKIAKPIFFRMDPERIHNIMLRTGSSLGNTPFRYALKAAYHYSNRSLETEVCGISFKNPLGLAAGFDKDGILPQVLPFVGFGFEEIGSVTGKPWGGNPKPRLFRLPEKKSLIVNFGLSSQGSTKVRKRLEGRRFRFPIGISIAGISREKSIDSGIVDYFTAFNNLSPLGDYMTINISCPNLSEGRTFCSPGNLKKLLKTLPSGKKPIFLKLKPDFTREEMDDIIGIIKKSKISGVIISNLTKDSRQPGGIGGKLVQEKSNYWLKYFYKKTKGSIPIIGCGGIFTAEDAWKKITLGASLLQMVTGLVYEGPGAPGTINKGLAQKLEKEGYRSISEAVGTAT